jgi:Domain of unknown function (DUF4386)
VSVRGFPGLLVFVVVGNKRSSGAGSDVDVLTERVSIGSARPAGASRREKAPRIAGIFFLVTFISIAALPLYHSVLKDHSLIVGAGGDTRVQLGALIEIITAIAGIGTAVALYLILRRQSEGLALGYVTVRVVESAPLPVAHPSHNP